MLSRYRISILKYVGIYPGCLLSEDQRMILEEGIRKIKRSHSRSFQFRYRAVLESHSVGWMLAVK